LILENRIHTDPGEVVSKEFLEPLGLTQVAFAAHPGVPTQRINEIVRGKRGVTPDTAWLFALALGTTPEFWLNLQTWRLIGRNELLRRYLRPFRAYMPHRVLSLTAPN
jgi:addiction module HigA family antidote